MLNQKQRHAYMICSSICYEGVHPNKWEYLEYWWQSFFNSTYYRLIILPVAKDL